MKRLNFEPSEPYATHIGPALTLKGKLRSSLPLDMRCTLRGSIEGSFVRIAPGADVEAQECSVTNAVIFGRFSGSMKASGGVIIFPKANVRANIKAAKLQIVDGAFFEGDIETDNRDNAH